MYLLNNKSISKSKLAEEACDIEINKLKEPVGKQDQYIASYGGLRVFNINNKGKVKVSNLNIKDKTKQLLENNLFFFTGYTRLSSSILKKQDKETKKKKNSKLYKT